MIENEVRKSLANLPEMAQARQCFAAQQRVALTGLAGGARAAVASLFLEQAGPWLLVVARQEQVREWQR